MGFPKCTIDSRCVQFWAVVPSAIYLYLWQDIDNERMDGGSREWAIKFIVSQLRLSPPAAADPIQS